MNTEAIIIYYSLCTPTDDIPFIDIQCTWLLVVFWASVVDQMLAGWYPPNFNNGRLCPEMQTNITVMNLATCFREQMQVPLNKKLEHCTTTLQSPNKRTIQAVWLL